MPVSNAMGDPQYTDWLTPLGNYTINNNFYGGPYITLSGTNTLSNMLLPYSLGITSNTPIQNAPWKQLFTAPLIFPNIGVTSIGSSGSGSGTTFNTTAIWPNVHREAFIAFVLEQLINKCLIFEELLEKKKRVVNKVEALKFACFHFTTRVIRPLPIIAEDIKFKDFEWHVHFKPAESSEELIEAIVFTRDEILNSVSI